MDEPEKIIKAYVEKVLKIQEEQKERPLDEDEMRRIALDLGMSESDIAIIQKKTLDYIARGKGYSRYEDWDSAIEEYQQAFTLAPGNLEALYGIANAYKQRWLLKSDKEDLNKAKSFVKKALQVNPHHDDSFRLASELNRGATKYKVSDPFKGFNTTKTEVEPWPNKIKEVLEHETIKFDSNRKLRKSNRDKKIFGVCAGIAEYFGVDSTWIRIAFILGTLFAGGAGFPLYIILAFALPKS